jgi:hypothetical protein
MTNRLIIKIIQYKEINDNIYGEFCSLRRNPNEKASRKLEAFFY